MQQTKKYQISLQQLLTILKLQMTLIEEYYLMKRELIKDLK
jgi:hypothetical protein